MSLFRQRLGATAQPQFFADEITAEEAPGEPRKLKQKRQGANEVAPIAFNDCFLFLTIRSPVNGVYHMEKALM